MKKILCVCMSSTIQRTITFENLTLTKVNRSRHYRIDASGKAVNSAYWNSLKRVAVELYVRLVKRIFRHLQNRLHEIT